MHVAEYASEIIGFCNIGVHKQDAQLSRIYLLPEFTGQGIDRVLLEQGEAFLLAHRIHFYSCFVHKKNEIGKRIYLHAGFEHMTEKDKEDEWFMEKSLSGR